MSNLTPFVSFFVVIFVSLARGRRQPEPTCTDYNKVVCCLGATNMTCPEFHSNNFQSAVCGGACGIPCIETGSDSPQEYIRENECVDVKPSICCNYLTENQLCDAELFTGCEKSCGICT